MKSDYCMKWTVDLVLVVACVGSLEAATMFVKSSGSHTSPFDSWVSAATNIQAAVDIAVDGDTVKVFDGNYVLTSQIVVTNAITIQSKNGSPNTRIDANDTSRCFYIDDDATVSGFTLTGGNADNVGVAEYPNYGGCVYLNREGLVRNCTITNNTAGTNSSSGGAVYMYRGGMVSNCAVEGNSASYVGGGVAMFGGGELWMCRITNNVASDGASPAGGGIYMLADGTEGCFVKQCFILNNYARGSADGGGVYMSGTNNILTAVTVTGNEADRSGGGVYINHGGLLRCSLLYGNTASNWGGAALISGDAEILSCTIASNRAGWGGGFYLITTGTVHNSIIYDNNATQTDGGDNYYNDPGSYGQYDYCCSMPALTGTANIATSPMFDDPTTNNYRLATNSPCIDSGGIEDWMSMPNAKDLDGKTRIIGSTVDIGAFEFGVDPTSGVTVAISSPTNGTSYSAPADIDIQVVLNPASGITVTQRIIYANSSAIYTGTEVTNLFTYSWTNVSEGNYALTFVAWPDTGDCVTSEVVTVSVTSATATAKSSVFRLYSYGSSESTYEHLWTTSETEKDVLDSYPSWQYECIAWYAYTNAESGSTPLYRLYEPNVKQHHYTISPTEYCALTNTSWTGEGIQYYVYATNSVSGLVPAYRFYHAVLQLHHFTTDENEKAAITNNSWGYVYEGVGFYVFQTNSASIRDDVEHLATADAGEGLATVESFVRNSGPIATADTGAAVAYDAMTDLWRRLALEYANPEEMQWFEVPGDYDGDSIADCALYCDGCWFVLGADGDLILWDEQWGGPGMVPVQGDYDGEGVSDLAVYCEASGSWYVRKVEPELILWDTVWGGPGMQPVAMDADQDGVSDLAVIDDATEMLFILSLDGRLLFWNSMEQE